MKKATLFIGIPTGITALIGLAQIIYQGKNTDSIIAAGVYMICGVFLGVIAYFSFRKKKINTSASQVKRVAASNKTYPYGKTVNIQRRAIASKREVVTIKSNPAKLVNTKIMEMIKNN